MSKKKRQHDPHLAREAEKYEHPIPSREFIIEWLTELGRPATFEEIADQFELALEHEEEALNRRLRAMIRDGQVFRNRRGGFCLITKMDLVRGRVMGHKDGFGFLVLDNGGSDLFLSTKQMRRVLHGDHVLARRTGFDYRGKPEAVIVEVLEHRNQFVVGRLVNDSGLFFVVPDNTRISQDILIPPEDINGATEGQIVTAEVLSQPSRRASPVGKIVEVLGDHMDPGMEIDIAVRSHALPHQWPEEVKEEMTAFGKTVAEADKAGRKDLRDLPFVTIDGEDAKDFDDAVYCETLDNGDWRLYVAIADVSHYVKPDSALDAEGYNRGNSVYFPSQVIPMLPYGLSNGLCSLKPNVDRLCMVCEATLTSTGEVRDFQFYSAVMHSHARLTYNKVAAMLMHGDKELRQQYKTLVPDLENLYRLYQCLKKRRVARGAIDFEIPETQILFDNNKKIRKIIARERNEAHRLIEECMLLANVCTAKFLLKHKMPGLFRIHASPDEKKINELHEFLADLGLTLKGGTTPEPKHYVRLLKQITERPDYTVIQTVLLRSMSQAVYHHENIGHFGLAYDAYMHFTSPIRRYPDLLVHRAIKHILAGGKPKDFPYSDSQMSDLGQHCSMTERRADDASRDVIDWLKCEFMLDKVGEAYSGKITGVTDFGLFISLDDIYVEGLLHITELSNDYYHFEKSRHQLEGELSGNVYRLGDELTIKVARVDLDQRKIDFVLAEKLPPRAKPAKKKKTKDKVKKSKPKSKQRKS